MGNQAQLGRQRGFTLVELLIVVIILAILAAIVVPQFSSSTSDAQLAALDQNLSTVRSAIELYKAQHGGAYPASTDAKGATCPSGSTAAIAASTAGTQQALIDQLSNPSNAAGQTCTITSGTAAAGFKFGPYLRKGVPTEPVSGVSTVTMTTTGATITAGTGGGWAYDTVSGQFIANNTTTNSTLSSH